MADLKRKTVKVPRACDRCKKQKLKCDVERPCFLCVRSGFDCTTTGHAPPHVSTSQEPRRKRKRDSSTNATRTQQIETVPLSEGRLLNQTSIDSTVPTSEESSDAEAQAHRSVGRSTSNLDLVLAPGSPSQVRGSRENARNTFVGDTSAMGLTKQESRQLLPESFSQHTWITIHSFNDTQHHSATSALPGGTEQLSRANADALFLQPPLPPVEVIEALIDSYFDTVHWFMFILHEGSFRQRAKPIISLGPHFRRGSDADFALLLMMVIALGAQYAGNNPRWRHRHIMSKHSVDLEALVPTLTCQVRAHLFSSLERCQLEAVQTCILLGTYYIYHGNPNLSWSVLGLAVKAAYALGLHREVDWKGDNALLQARKRAWGHTFIADTFAAVIYGRPATVDRDFCDVSYPDECDDTDIPMPLKAYLNSINGGKNVSKLTYHTHKYRLYDIKAQIIRKIYTLRARASFQTSGSGLPKLVKTVRSFDCRLKAWQDNLPVFFKQSSWSGGEGDPADVFSRLEDTISESEERIKRHLVMQRIALQLLYDYILILLHRPLLEYRMSSRQQDPETSHWNPFPNSFKTCLSAAMRISYTPANKFEYNCPMALITMHMLTAGVILCIPATMDPFSITAHEAKGAVVRMIRMFKRLSAQTPVVAQSCTILEELMKVVLTRELELVLRPEVAEEARTDSSSHPMDETTNSRNTENGFSRCLREDSHTTPLESSQSLPFFSKSPATQMRSGAAQHLQTSIPRADGYLLQQGSIPPEEGNSDLYPLTFGDHSMSTISPEGYGNGQTYDFIDAEPDHGFNMAFGALERVIYDNAPSEWMNPAWMHPYKDMELFPMHGHGFGENWMGLTSDDVSTTVNYEGSARNSFELGATLPCLSSQLYGGTCGQENDRSKTPYNFADLGPA
ncbi:uncharacterized protein PAC_12227 [Phialocephala subalpina]|uniref:Zn(2)-C6 fungal-type domain-containing protein n=1 Tax=Phialocephala subalpina TaxID=576137 RepID=A0A1L7XBA9_9HELO|nr:uncharacterized protein PAC_12227 [Phialocephala subalpina]